jgi:riboflavin kinase/FMN adenylyltransferase
MEIFRNIYDTMIVPECAATIGVFDGVHAGHRQVIRQMMDEAQQHGYKSMVITFDKLPQQLFVPGFQPQLITTLDEKIQLLEELGIDYLVVLPFDMQIAQLTAREFMTQILHEHLNVKALCIGYDNQFGRGRMETFDDYVEYGKALGMRVFKAIEVQFEGFDVPVSSSLIRHMIAEEGKVFETSQMLKHYYKLTGSVVAGEHIGTGLGYPTANVVPDNAEKLIPADGVYAVWASIEGGEPMQAMMNIGKRPTFDGKQRTLEVHIFDFEGDLYGKQIAVSFAHIVRYERYFSSAEELKRQIKKDEVSIKELFEKIKKFTKK